MTSAMVLSWWGGKAALGPGNFWKHQATFLYFSIHDVTCIFSGWNTVFSNAPRSWKRSVRGVRTNAWPRTSYSLQVAMGTKDFWPSCFRTWELQLWSTTVTRYRTCVVRLSATNVLIIIKTSRIKNQVHLLHHWTSLEAPSAPRQIGIPGSSSEQLAS